MVIISLFLITNCCYLVDRWGGPLPQSWLDDQLALQKKILRRMYEFGMSPGNETRLQCLK